MFWLTYLIFQQHNYSVINQVIFPHCGYSGLTLIKITVKDNMKYLIMNILDSGEKAQIILFNVAFNLDVSPHIIKFES